MLEFLQNVLFVGSIVLVIVIIVQLVNAKKPKREVVKLRSGSLGSGKTLLSSINVKRDYRFLKFLYRHRKNFILRFFKLALDKEPRVYSNIPIYLGHKEYADVLTREHMLCIETFPSNVTPLVLWDEAGMSASQYSYDDPNIISDNVNDNSRCVEVFIRLFRHFYGEGNRDRCRLYLTDQATGDICINLRRRFGSVDCLSNFRRFLGFTPFYKIDVNTLMMQEDNVVNTNNTMRDPDKKQEYYFGFLPYRWMQRHPAYSSHAYHGEKYVGHFVSSLPFTNWKDNNFVYVDDNGVEHLEKMMTNYCPDLRMSRDELAIYKAKIQLVQKRARDEVFKGA